MLECNVCSLPNITLVIQAQKFNFGLIQLLSYPRGLEQTIDSSNVLFGDKWKREVVFPCNFAMHTTDVQCSPDGLHIDCSHCKRDL